jgi:deazaflavin-dependent oxidoreductase (nitroreductase family)
MSRELNTYDQQVITAFRASGGVLESGLDLLLLHHLGARSGHERVTPLAYWRLDNTTVAVLASNRGAPKHPSWYHNLVANPDATAEIGTKTFPARARVAAAAERNKLLQRIVEQTPSVSAAINRTSRAIPVVILDLGTANARPAATR